MVEYTAIKRARSLKGRGKLKCEAAEENQKGGCFKLGYKILALMTKLAHFYTILLVLTGLGHLLVMFQKLFTFLQKRQILMKRSTVQNLALLLCSMVILKLNYCGINIKSATFMAKRHSQ
jgi:hypothetical protein